jgi:hypothetical protein
MEMHRDRRPASYGKMMNPHDLAAFIAAELGWIAALLDLRAARDTMTGDSRRDATSIIAAWLEHLTNLQRN